eukprot:CAMPEP_0195522870 /NCGR_PEP_ID=MMETSP0794_2-20130614/21458_1 /TAXON_ID=515487 /ORGANISM="Stephanopyxis turris, Strain CCMP 815" /LENGTH=88 /DNA_ID=CAMNT_0040652729 /DNA_START=27 /DNA_END=290 /DNA_ORIENTATION=+
MPLNLNLSYRQFAYSYVVASLLCLSVCQSFIISTPTTLRAHVSQKAPVFDVKSNGEHFASKGDSPDINNKSTANDFSFGQRIESLKSV